MTSLASTSAAVLVAAALLTGCSSPGAASPAPTTSPRTDGSVAPAGEESGAVKLDVGHCWVESVLFDGERWGLPFGKQFGWGGGEPENWRGNGAMERLSEDRARYSDHGGAVLTFLPADTPSVRRVEGELCD